MRAVVIDKPGGPEVLVVRDVPKPEPVRGEARVRVHATAINRADLLQRAGYYPAPPGVPADIPGMEFAGVVDAIGEGVTHVTKGDRVFGLIGGGSYAEYVVVHALTLSRMPELKFEEAASIPEAFVTAYDAMVTQAGLAAGETVLVHAVGSGVGTAAVQIARAIGARAIGTARTAAKMERATPLGMDEGIVVADGKFADAVNKATASRGVDVVLDLVGGSYVAEALKCIALRGRIVVVGLVGGGHAEIPLAQLLHKRVTMIGTVLRARPLDEKIAIARTFERHVVPLLARGALVPIVDRVFPLDRASEAHAYVASNESFGKVVLAV